MEIGRYLKAGKSFGIWRVDPPFKPVTAHGSGRKLGGGKGSISHYVTPVKAGRVIVEVGGKVLWEEIRPVLNFIAAKLPFDAMAVSQEQMERLDAEEERLITGVFSTTKEVRCQDQVAVSVRIRW